MVRIRRGGYIFRTCIGDHAPRNVHVFKDGVLVVKWNLDGWVPVTGRTSRRITQELHRLREEGRI